MVYRMDIDRNQVRGTMVQKLFFAACPPISRIRELVECHRESWIGK